MKNHIASFTRLKALSGHPPCSVYQSFIPWYCRTVPHGEDVPYFVIYSPASEHLGCFPPGKFEKAAVNISAPVFSFTHVFSLLSVWRQESPGWH